jgi:uncharacterized protein YbaR (Trm112 family)
MSHHRGEAPRCGGIRYTRIMVIHSDLLDVLACPVCKTPVELVKKGQALHCSDCRRVYHVRDDIPIMLSEEATIED